MLKKIPTGGGSADITEEFDTESGMYIETLAKGLEFVSSVPNGAVLSDGVYFEMPSNISAHLMKDGENIDFHNKTAVSSQGYYILRLSGVDTSGETITGVFTFRIGSAPSNKVNTGEYKYPKIKSTATVSSDYNTGLYKYTLPNYKAFFTSVPTYGETVESASFIIPRNLGYSLTKDGSTIAYMENKTYTDAGNYSLKVYGLSYASGGGYEACYETILNFTISGGSSGSYADQLSEFSDAVSSAVTSAKESAISKLESYVSKDDSSESSVISDTLRESYFETANIYSESFSTGDSFYTNIPNDGIVGGNVYFDMPYNMSVSMLKDGTPVEFKNKTYINDSGSYSMTVTDVYEGVTSRAKFTFRIQSGVETPGGMQDEDDEDEDSETDSADEDVSYTVANEYDTSKRMYVFSLGSENVYMSVPNGMVSNDSVSFNISDDIEKGLTKDDAVIDYADTLYDDGKYVLSLVKDDEALNLEFYIAKDPVNYLDEFVLPEGYSLIAADYSDYADTYSDTDETYVDGLSEIELQSQNYSAKVFSLPIDGEYDFILQGSGGMPIISFSLFIDRIAPEITFDGLNENMSTSEDNVTIHCEETDADVVLVDSSGNETSLDMSGGGGKISGKGTYTLIAKDAAGNENEYQFTLGNGGLGMKIYLVVFLLGFVALTAGVVLIVKRLLFGGDKKDGKEKKPEKKKAGKKTENTEKDGGKAENKDKTSLLGGLSGKIPKFGGLKKNDKIAEEEALSAENDDDDWDDNWDDDDDFDFDDEDINLDGDDDDFDDDLDDDDEGDIDLEDLNALKENDDDYDDDDWDDDLDGDEDDFDLDSSEDDYDDFDLDGEEDEENDDNR
ncbi:MAG: hypothetical protein LUC92_08750 [Clostridiales bacterium]|nr:hypothetical protein [Clostridiales bacterium]